MKTYHFSRGNSTNGPSGLCAEVVAHTRKEAVSKLRNALANSLGPLGMLRIPLEHASVEYANVYVNPDSISVSQIEFRQPISERR